MNVEINGIQCIVPLEKEDVTFCMQYSHERKAYMFYASVNVLGKQYKYNKEISCEIAENYSMIIDYESMLQTLAYHEICNEIKNNPPTELLDQLDQFYEFQMAFQREFEETMFAPRIEPEFEKVDWTREGF